MSSRQGVHASMRYGIAVVFVALAWFATGLFPDVEPTPAVLFLLAVTLSARFAGLGPALLATFSSTLLLDYFFIGEIHSVELGREATVLLVVFALAAILISSLYALQHRLEITLRARNRRQSEFMAILAHELRNFLAPIPHAVAAMRLRGSGDPATERSCDLVDRQTLNMSRLVADLLDVARIGEGKVRLELQTVDLAEVVDYAAGVARPLIESRGQSFQVDVPRGPLPLEADRTRLEQVFVNLLTNAAKYTEGGGQVALVVERRSRALEVRIKDSGQGIEPEALAHVFELFSQTRPGSGGGLGIGLSLVRGLVELHGGTVTASSMGSGRGSEFVVRLPAASVAAEPAEASGAGRSIAPRSETISSGSS